MNKIIISLGMVLLTLVYCRLIWLGFGFYRIILPAEMVNIPVVTRLTAFHALPWQILAVISLVLNVIWLFRKNDSSRRQRNSALPLTCHIGWIIFSLCCHGIGMLTPHISFASVLSN